MPASSPGSRSRSSATHSDRKADIVARPAAAAPTRGPFMVARPALSNASRPHEAADCRGPSSHPRSDHREVDVAYLITHFFEGGTKSRSRAIIGIERIRNRTFPPARPAMLPGRRGGWLVVARWDSKVACDTFVDHTPLPVPCGPRRAPLAGPPRSGQARSWSVIDNLEGHDRLDDGSDAEVGTEEP